VDCFEDCVRSRSTPLLPAACALAAGIAALASGCGGGLLSAHLEAPPVTVRADNGMQELRFTAVAHTTDTIADGQFDIHVRVDNGAAGQVRVSVSRAASGGGDLAPVDDVVPCDADASVVLPTSALAGCLGDCIQPFVVELAGEGLPQGAAVSLPVVIDATLAYENAPTAPPGDTLVLALP
jgi:hypothetical protein